MGINVRLSTISLLNSIAHNKPHLLQQNLQEILPKLYEQTLIRKELIREVMMGPFKHSVDDGLDLRKAAFECMYTLLDTLYNKLDMLNFVKYVQNGLKDNYGIKMLTFHLVIRMSALCPEACVTNIDQLVEPLKITCMSKVKADSVKQEFEKQDELKKSALRAVYALLQIPQVKKSQQMQDFLTQMKSNSDLQRMFDSIHKDATQVTNAQKKVESMDLS